MNGSQGLAAVFAGHSSSPFLDSCDPLDPEFRIFTTPHQRSQVGTIRAVIKVGKLLKWVPFGPS
jgi:hypothetical protein